MEISTNESEVNLPRMAGSSKMLLKHDFAFADRVEGESENKFPL